MAPRSKAFVYRVDDPEADEDPYNAPTKLAPSALADAQRLLVERLPPSYIPVVYDPLVDEYDAGADGSLGTTPSGTRIMSSAPPRAAIPSPRPPAPEFRIHVTPAPAPALPQKRARSRKRSWIERLPTALLVAVIVGSLLVGAAGVAMFLYYC